MTPEIVRLIATYLIAVIVIIGGGIIVFSQRDQIPSAELLPFLTFAMGSVLGYVFNRDASQAGHAAALDGVNEAAERALKAKGIDVGPSAGMGG